jgi:CNP1-like family
LRRLLLLFLAAFAAQAAGQANVEKSNWELEQERRDGKGSEIRLPAYPKADGLVEFFVSGAASFRFFIDPASLSVESDGVVRYTLVARSPSGVANISYEGIRCEKGADYRVFALGSDGRWSVRDSEWRPIEPRAIQRWHNELYRRYFCPNDALISTAAEGVDALRRGGHPSVIDSMLRR